MDDHFWIDIRLFPYADDGAEHVPYCGKIEEADGKILWNQVGSAARFRGSFLLYFRGDHVFGKENPGKTCLAGKIEAAEIEFVLSRLHSWFYSPIKSGRPAGILTGQAR